MFNTVLWCYWTKLLQLPLIYWKKTWKKSKLCFFIDSKYWYLVLSVIQCNVQSVVKTTYIQRSHMIEDHIWFVPLTDWLKGQNCIWTKTTCLSRRPCFGFSASGLWGQVWLYFLQLSLRVNSFEIGQFKVMSRTVFVNFLLGCIQTSIQC